MFGNHLENESINPVMKELQTTSKTRKNWSNEELIVAFNLYCKIPFGRINHRTPKIIELANMIGRTPHSTKGSYLSTMITNSFCHPDLYSATIKHFMRNGLNNLKDKN